MNYKRLLTYFLAPLLIFSLLSACSDDDNGGIVGPGNGDDNGDDTELNIVETADADDRFSTLVEFIGDAELVDALSGDDLTVFAPTNDAFDTLFETVDPAELSPEDLIEILTYHVTSGTILSGNINPGDTGLTMLNKEQTLVQASAAGVLINGFSNVVDPDITASNGVIHAIDEVLLPSAFRDPSIVELALADEEGRFDTLAELVENASGDGLELLLRLQFLQGYTAFAPTNEAFANLDVDVSEQTEQLVGILTYHVTQGEAPILSTDLEPTNVVPTLAEEEPVYVTVTDEGVFVNRTSQVVAADIQGSNGVIHAVDEVLLPNAILPLTGIVSKNFNLEALLGLVAQFPGLLETLGDQEGEFTVFAPNNEAFAGVDPNDFSEEELEQILTYHVVPGTILSGDLKDGQTATTVEGSDVTVSIDGDNVQINDANVVTVDLVGTNGVVHIIDSILMPPND